MIRILLVALVTAQLCAGLAFGQCKDYKDPITGATTRIGNIMRLSQVEHLMLLYAGDSLTFGYVNTLAMDPNANFRLGDMAILKTATGLDTLYVSKEVARLAQSGLVGNFAVDPDRLARYLNPEAIRFHLIGTTYDVVFSKKEQRQWNQILNCILPPGRK